MEWYRPLPPPSGEVTLAARDNLELSGNRSAGSVLSQRRQCKSHAPQLLQERSRFLAESEPPYVFLIPDGAGRSDSRRANGGRLMGQHSKKPRPEPAETDGRRVPRGHLCRAPHQPYRNYAVDLLTPQHYPKNGRRTRRRFAGSRRALPAAGNPDRRSGRRAATLAPLTEKPHPAGAVAGSGPVFLLKDTGQEGLLAARYRLADFATRNRRASIYQRRNRLPVDRGSSPRTMD